MNNGSILINATVKIRTLHKKIMEQGDEVEHLREHGSLDRLYKSSDVNQSSSHSSRQPRPSQPVKSIDVDQRQTMEGSYDNDNVDKRVQCSLVGVEQ